MTSRVTGDSSVCSAVCSDWQQRNIKGPRYCPFVRGIHWWFVVSPHKGTVTRETFPFDDVIMNSVDCQTTVTKCRPHFYRKDVVPLTPCFWFLILNINNCHHRLPQRRPVCTYRQVPNISRTKSQHLKDSRTVLRLSLPNPLKPDVKSRMRM